MRVETHSAQDTQALAASLAPVLPAGTWIRLEGDLGAGKTTFTQGLGKALGIARAIKSPTYTIVKEYDLEGQAAPRLIHIDAYRLEEGGADTVDLASYRPQGDLACDDPAQHQPVGVELRILSGFGVDVRKMPFDGVVGKRLQRGDVPPGCSILEGGDPDMALGGSGQYGPGFRAATMDAVARGDDRETARRRDVQRVHRFADQVFAQHRSQRRLAVTLA